MLVSLFRNGSYGMQLSELLKECLERAQLNQGQAAIKLGRGLQGRKHLNAILNNRQRPSLEVVEKILGFCGLTLEDCLRAPRYFDITKKEDLARRALEKGINQDLDAALRVVFSAFDPSLFSQIPSLSPKTPPPPKVSQAKRKTK